jgi:hypothetical protein
MDIVNIRPGEDGDGGVAQVDRSPRGPSPHG